jgi:hypothetical protein
MANVIIFEDGVAQYLESVNTPDYEGNPNAIVEPDLSLVEGVPMKFWKQDGDEVLEMTQAEKDAVLAAELQTRKARADEYNIDLKTAITALIKVVNIRLPANQKITKQEMIDALKAEIL